MPRQHRQVFPGLDLTRFVYDDGLDWDEVRKSTIKDPICCQHANRAKDDSGSHYQVAIELYVRSKVFGFDHVGANGFIEVLVPSTPITSVYWQGNLVSEQLTNRNGNLLTREV